MIEADLNNKIIICVFACITIEKYKNELTRKNFSLFRNNVIRNLPKTSQNKDFIGKSTIEIIKIVKRQNCNNYNK